MAGRLVAAGAAEETKAIGRVPWGVVVMVCGMTALIRAVVDPAADFVVGTIADDDAGATIVVDGVTILGEDGDDFRAGGPLNDDLAGGDGDDTLFGQEGGDILDGGAGSDLLLGDPSGAAGDSIIGARARTRSSPAAGPTR